jgi:hypothetical protein
MSSDAAEKDARVTELLKHVFFKCNTGQCIVQHLNARLRGSGRIALVTKEDPPGVYYISVTDGSRVTRAPFDDRMVLFSHGDLLAVLGVAQFAPDAEKTNFANYTNVLEEHFESLSQGKSAIVIDSENGAKEIPSVKLMALEDTVINRIDTPKSE